MISAAVNSFHRCPHLVACDDDVVMASVAAAAAAATDAPPTTVPVTPTGPGDDDESVEDRSERVERLQPEIGQRKNEWLILERRGIPTSEKYCGAVNCHDIAALTARKINLCCTLYSETWGN